MAAQRQLPYLPYFPTLDLAIAAADGTKRVWARDRLLGDRQGSKQYVVARERALYQELLRRDAKHRVYYEVLLSGTATRFYLDVEFERATSDAELSIVKSNVMHYFNDENDAQLRGSLMVRSRALKDTAFSEQTASKVIHQIQDMLATGLQARFDPPENVLAGTVVMTASTPSKLSFHIVTNVSIDDQKSSGAALAYDLGMSFRLYFVMVMREIHAADPGLTSQRAEVLLILLQLHKRGKSSFAMDLAPYARRQLFRLGGCTKAHQKRFLRPLAVNVPVITGADSPVPTMASLFPSSASWAATLCQGGHADLWPNDHEISYAYNSSYPWPKPVGADGNMDQYPHVSEFIHDHSTAERLRLAGQPGIRAAAPHVRLATVVPGHTSVLDDITVIVGEDGVSTRAFVEYREHEQVYCPRCETNAKTDAQGRTVGYEGVGPDPSAVITLSASGQNALYCFADCKTMFFCSLTFVRQPMYVQPHQEVHLASGADRINMNGRQDFKIDPSTRLSAVSAPTGAGKSTLITSYLDGHPEAKVLAISYRQSLACYQANRWSCKQWSPLLHDLTIFGRVSALAAFPRLNHFQPRFGINSSGINFCSRLGYH
ncbi:hypothetical protein L198_08253 [Cryptococcus wingfieldii CBS 7118]|uniref:Uncharacterized protein n=1 Tax=Cryptococcus wingfieldii CBS 7118 TaxID=1295528 RepID=A0A1E3HD46_9TREE|nr:hypothetical protein L198_08253 [Cryptococcus wingfieldii CBS 7118]ODN74257.1 hypothetical protein L198_08253 [Cryptococcus wingfieldii CBS 7118]